MTRLLLAGFAVAAVVSVRAQSLPRFEAASVRAVPEGYLALCGDDPAHQVPCGNIIPRAVDPQRFRALSPLSGPMGILEWAFDVRQFQVMGAPEWLKQQSFEILAGAENPSNEGQFKQMVQSLLADRFQLKVHRETRDVDVYALVVGKNGPKFDAAKSAPRNQGMGDIEVRPGRLFGRAATMDLLAHILTDNLERPVLDRTNLTGNYDFDLTYDQNSTGAGFTPLGGAIFVPIQDLGLKIEPQRDAVEVLVIDSIGRPSEN